jgi:cell wall-associated NlpC family hydrolase
MKKTIITAATGIMLVFSSFNMPNLGDNVAHAAVQTAQEATVTSTVNFRTSPSSSSRIIGTLSSGTKVEVVGQISSAWVKVKVSGSTGYVSSSFLTLSSSGQATNTNQTTTTKSNSTQSNVADKVIQTGLKYQGTRYVFGARSGQTSSFDCSSFVQYIFGQHNISLPRNSRQQATVGDTIMKKEDLNKGDLIFFVTGIRSDGRIDHVGVYMGDGKFIHTIPNGGVQVSNLSGSWLKNAVGAKRVIK